MDGLPMYSSLLQLSNTNPLPAAWVARNDQSFTLWPRP